jgi:hypothetical protein
MNLRHRPVDSPPRPHLAPVQDVCLLHSSQVGHINTFSSNRIYRTPTTQVNATNARLEYKVTLKIAENRRQRPEAERHDEEKPLLKT